MKNTDALVTVAMLSAYLSNEKKDYIDIIIPFVLNILPNKPEAKVDLLSITESLRDEYGFEDVPIHVLSKILNRISKNKNEYVRRHKDIYYVKNIYVSDEFQNNRINTKKMFRDIFSAMQKNNDVFRNNNDAEKYLLRFLTRHGFTLMKSVDDLSHFTIKDDRYDYLVARFILQEYKDDSIVYAYLLQLIKGFFVYKAIYYFYTDQIKATDFKLNHTDFYMDTRLLINVLGYNRDEDKRAARELISLLKSHKSNIKTFAHYKDEVANILTAYARDKTTRSKLSLSFLYSNNYDEVDVIRLRQELEMNINGCGIEMVELPEYGIVCSEDLKLGDESYLDVNELKQVIASSVNYSKKKDETALMNDVNTISAICRLRGKSRSCTLDNCKAVFVTPNYSIVLTTLSLYKERFSKGELPFVISDIDLTAILWLKSFHKESELPQIKLLECAIAAYQPSQKLIEVFLGKVDQLEKEENITPENALLMRANLATSIDIAELTENDPDRITDEIVKTAEERLKNRLRDEDATTINKLEEEIISFKEQKKRAFDNVEDIAKNKSDKYVKNLKIILYSLISILILIGIYCIVASFLQHNLILGFTGLITLLISVISLVLLIFPSFNLISKKLEELRAHRFAKIHADEINKLKSLYP